MVSLADAIAALYPKARPLRDYRVESDQTGERIAYWDEDKLGPRPTPGQLAAVTDAHITEARAERIRAEALVLMETPSAMRTVIMALGLDINEQLNRQRGRSGDTPRGIDEARASMAEKIRRGEAD